MSGGLSLVQALEAEEPLVMVELRPPEAGLDATASMDAWIDGHHAVRRLRRSGRFVLLTDNAVGRSEEENLAHLEGNLSAESDPIGVIPFLTCKHPLEYCLWYADRAWSSGFRAITVVGGDQGGPPRCLPHAYQLRERIRSRVPDLSLGGWVNPHRDPVEQVGFLTGARDCTDFYLSQVVSEHSAPQVERFLNELELRGVGLPGAFGVFYYRSAHPYTLRQLGKFFPVPSKAVAEAFDRGVPPEELCARSLRALRKAGVRHVYLSNLSVRTAAATVEAVLQLV